MTSHPRALIRAAFVAALGTGAGDPPSYPTAAGPRVFSTRLRPVNARKETPLILVGTPEERVQGAFSDAPPIPRRILTVQADVLVAQEDGYDGQADLLALAVERAIERACASAWPLGLDFVESVSYRGASLGAYGEGETSLAAARVNFEASYWLEPAWAAGLDDFLRYGAGWDLSRVARVLVGGEAELTEGEYYQVLAGEIGGRTGGPFRATAEDVAGFVAATQRARLLSALDLGVLTV